nr:PKD-like domain-containing protein [uncultured Sediminibacterium sp.]
MRTAQSGKGQWILVPCTRIWIILLFVFAGNAAFSQHTLTICSGQSFDFKPPAASSSLTYTWGVPTVNPAGSVNATPQATPQTGVIQTLTNNTSDPATVTYNVQASNNTTFTLEVTVNPLPRLSGGTATANICSGQTFIYAASSATAGTTIAWNRSQVVNILPNTNNGTGSVSEALTNTSDVSLTSNYIYTLTANGCVNNQTVSVVVNPLPTLNSSLTPPDVCSGAQFSYTPSSTQSNINFTWTRSLTGGISNAASTGSNSPDETLINTTLANVPVTYNYNLQSTATGCTNTQAITMNVKPIPNLSSSTSNDVRCSGTSFIYNPTSSLGGTSITWSRAAVAGISPSGGLGSGNINEVLVNTTATTPATVTYEFTLNAAGCINTQSFNVLVNPRPQLSSSANLNTVCSGSTFNYNPTSLQSNITFNWSRAAVAGITNGAATGSDNPQEALNNNTLNAITLPYTYTLLNTVTGCNNIQNVFVQVSPIPNIAPGTENICNGQAFSHDPAGAPASTTYTWGVPVISPSLAITGGNAQSIESQYVSQTLNNVTGSIATATYTVTPRTNGCLGSDFTVTVNVSSVAPPSIPLNSSFAPAPVCSGTLFNYVATTSANAPSFAWRRYAAAGITNTATTGTGSAINETLINSTTTPVNVQYAISITSLGCTNTHFITATVNPTTALSSSLTPAPVCSNQQFSYVPTSNTISTTQFNWSRAFVAGISNAAASGTNNPNEALINTTNSPISVVYAYNLVTAGGCSNNENVTVVVNPTPKLSSTLTPADICSEGNFIYNPTSPTTGGSIIFQWSRTAVNGISNGSSAGTGSANEFLFNTTVAPITVPYSYTTLVNGCSNTQVVNVVVKPTPAITNKVSTICSNTSFTTTINNVPTNTLYSWGSPVSSPAGIITGGTTGNLVGSIGQQLFNTSANPAVLTYTVTPNADGCAGIPFAVSVTVNPIPVAANITLPAICSGASFNYTPVGIQSNTIYSWGNAVVTPLSSLSGAIAEAGRTSIGQTLTNITNATSSAVYTVTPSANGCTGNNFTVTVPVNPKASIATINATVCSGNSFSVSPTPVPDGTSYTWTTPTIVPNGTVAGAVSQSAPVTSVSQFVTNTSNVPVQAQYSVTPITGACAGNNFTVNLTVNPATQLSSSLTPAAICSNTAFTYVPTSNTPSTATFNWTRAVVTGINNPAASGANNLNEVLVNNSNTPLNVTYVYTLATTEGCTNTQNITVTVNPIPVLTSVSNAPDICSGNTFNYFPTSNVAGTSFTWTRALQAFINNGAATGNNNPAEVLVNNSLNQVPVVYNYLLSANGCQSQQTVALQIKPTPAINNQTLSSCSNVPFSFSPANVPANTLYTWGNPTYNPGGTLTGGAAQIAGVSVINQTLVNQTINTSIASYTITPVANGCQGTPFTLAVSVQPIPVITDQVLSNVCSGSAFSFAANNAPIGTTYTWRNPLISPFNSLSGGSAQSVGQTAVSQVLSSTNNVVNTAVYTVTPSFNGCNGNDFTLTTQVNPTPIINNIVDTICTGASISIVPTNVPANTRYTWTNPTAIPFGAITGSTAQNTSSASIFQTLINTTNSPARLIYTVTPTAGFCVGNPFTVTAHVGSQLPAISNQNAEICSGTAFNISPVNAPPGTTYTWTLPTVAPANSVTGISNAIFQQPSVSEVLYNNTFANGTATYTVVAKNTGCNSNIFTATVRVLPKPRAIITGDSVICRYPFDTLNMNFAGNAPWSFSYWDNNGPIVNVAGVNTNPYAFPVPASVADTRVLSFTNFRQGACFNNEDTIRFTQIINPLPVGTMNTRRGIYLCNNISDTLFITSPQQLTYQWTHNGSAINGAIGDSLETGIPGRYNAVMTNQYGCVDTLSQGITLIKINQPILKFMYDTYCINTPVHFTNLTDTNTTGPIVWKWEFGNTNIQNSYNAENIYTIGGNHEIRLTASQLYCPATPTSMDSIIDIHIPIPGVNMPSVSAYKTVPLPIEIRDIPGYRYRWTPSWGINRPNSRSVLFNYTTTQQYAIELISPAGCITRDSLLVRVFDNKLVDIMIPKSFSPNGDGINDKLFVYLSGIKEFKYFKVYNRFNQLMFETKNHDEGWNGTFNGTKQPMGIYIWVTVGVAEDGSLVQRTGQTLLLR